MTNVTIRELRNNGGEVVDRAARGEEITITRAGRPVAALRPLASKALLAEALIARWRGLPTIDAARLRTDLDDAVESSP